MRVVKYILRTLVFIILTILTQVGGVIYLLSLLTHAFIDRKTGRKISRVGLKFGSFLLLYLLSTFLIVPVLARPFGRVALPITESGHLQPLNIITCLLNRHYVRPELKEATLAVAKQMNARYPGTVINYLDANFPFINKFPLIPHLSHNDGKKLDLAFLYIDQKSGSPSDEAPSIIGYGVNEEPAANEINMPGQCALNGSWQYSFMSKIIPQGKKADFVFDAIRTKAVVNLFVSEKEVGKIFIEPHLKTRLKLTSDKIRFHGCQAVRHDDHIHVQLR
jgi:hypothetical protein